MSQVKIPMLESERIIENKVTSSWITAVAPDVTDGRSHVPIDLLGR